MNRKLFHLALFISLPLLSFSQFHWDIGGTLGASNYLGDIGGKDQTRRDFVADLKFSQTHIAGSIFARYKVSQNFSMRSAFTYGRISGNDALSTNPGRAGRNLSFRNDLLELSATGEFCFLRIMDVGHGYRYTNDFKAYVFGGVAGLYSNPKAEYMGKWYALQPLRTENVAYNRFQLALPAGAGFYYTIDKQQRIGWELGWRTTFTDYLDDISTVYADPSGMSQIGSKLANRNDELQPYTAGSDLPAPQNYDPGSKRGDPTHNDSYMFSSVNYSYVIKGHSKQWHSWNHDHPRYHNIVFSDKWGGKYHRTHRIKL